MITDELKREARGFGRYVYTAPQADCLNAIADRIDELVGREYIELPKDADGVTINLGDVMDNTHKDGFRAKRVTGICYHDGGKTTIMVDEDRLRWHDAYKLHHAKPDSWERIIEDAQADGVRYHNDGRPSDFDALVARCKRLAGEDA